jgi:hypothetical protein
MMFRHAMSEFSFTVDVHMYKANFRNFGSLLSLAVNYH